MKKIIFILAVILGVAFIHSCEKYDEVVLDMENTIAPELISPASGGEFVLLRNDAGDVFATFEWTEAEYDLESVPEIRYVVQIDFADSLFKNARDLANTADMEADVTVGALNQRLIALNAEPGQAYDFAFRVFSFLNRSAEYTYSYSDEIVMNLTPYEDVVGDNPIYLLGNASEAGWSNTDALELTSIGDSDYEIVAYLDGQFIKFISVLGQWAPQWGQESGDANSGTLSYRPSEDVPDPDAIDVSVLDAGDYRITADTAALTYKVEPVTMTMFLMGTATEAGEDHSAALEMTRTAAGVYSITAELTSGETLFFIETLGDALPFYGTNSAGTWEEGNLVYKADAADPDPVMIPAPDADGEYLIEVNLSTRQYSVTLPE